MKKYQGIFCVEQMAKILGVSCSGYYDFLKRSQSARALKNASLVKEINNIFQESHETYGSPRIHAELCERGFQFSRPRVARLMRAHNIQAKTYRKFVKTTKRAKKCPRQTQDLIRRNFQVGRPNRVWVADLTYIRVNQHWVYLGIVLDLFSRKVVGMSLKNRMKTDLILSALNQALTHRNPPKGLIHHSDLGSQLPVRT